MLEVSGDKVVRTGSVCAFREFVVVGIDRFGNPSHRSQDVRIVLHELQQLSTKSVPDMQLWPRKDICVFLEDRA